MKTRTCPNCGYRYSYKQYLKEIYFFSAWNTWSCKNCGSILTFNLGKRIIITIIAMLPVLLFASITPDSWDHLIFPPGLSFVIYLIFYIAWYFFIFSFDTFKLVNNKNIEEAKNNKLV